MKSETKPKNSKKGDLIIAENNGKFYILEYDEESEDFVPAFDVFSVSYRYNDLEEPEVFLDLESAKERARKIIEWRNRPTLKTYYHTI